ncbi:MAG TPA: hypothetical protein VG122_15970 [Gemmata sp.]|jgi:hypothetical protein|nr:hypothetical protein [Gemmata sp.]
MIDLLKENPWLVVSGLALLIPIFGIVFGTITNYLSTVRRAELEASLKQDMLQRGMSAEEIKTVIEATSGRIGKYCKSETASHI